MSSIVDVARRAQVGTSTVSRVLNGKGYVSKATRRKVMEAVEALDYAPNELARNLLRNRTFIIAVIVPDIANCYFSALANEIERFLRQKGYKTMLCNSVGRQTNEEAYLNMLACNMVDGVITCSNLLDSADYGKMKRPIVSLDSALSPDIPMVCADHRTGGRAAASLLIRAGCKRLLQFRDSVSARLANNPKGINASLEDFPYALRHVEFQKTAEAAGVRYAEILADTVSVTPLRKLADDGFLTYPDADGVMATDIIALQYAHIAMAHGKRIPEDLKIVAYDGTDLTRIFYPQVCAIVQPVAQIAETAVDLLIRRIEGKPIPNKRVILPVSILNALE